MRNCSHPSCECQADETAMLLRDGRRYCSEHCASEGLAGDGPCQCGHPDCM